MFGDLVGYATTDFNNSSDEYNARVDRAVKQILDVSVTHAFRLSLLTLHPVQESFERVANVLQTKDKELRRLSRALYEQDYLDADEMDKVIRGVGLGKEKEENKVRTWDTEKYGPPLVSFKGGQI